jgi:O-antigen ligase
LSRLFGGHFLPAQSPEIPWHPATERTLFVLLATIPAIAVALIAAELWQIAVALFLIGTLVLASVQNVRIAILLGVGLATFTNYGAGRLTFEISIIASWLVWSGLIIFIRSKWVGWKFPRRPVMMAAAIWLVVCLLGAVHGVINQNSMRFLLLEVLAAGWPLLSFAVLQAFGSNKLRFVLVGLVLIGLIHSFYGLSALQIFGQRIGGVYFTTVPAVVAVFLWVFVLLTERRGLRWAALLAMVPMIVHLFFSFTRGYWLAFIAAMIVATALAWRSLAKFDPGQRWRPVRMLGELAAIVLLATVVAILYSGEGAILDTAGSRFSSAFRAEVADSETASNVFRLIEFAEAIRMSLASPVVGYGFGAVLASQDPFLGTRTTQWFIHNYYLLIWYKLGLIGLIAFGLLIFSLVRDALRVGFGSTDLEVRVTAIGAMAFTVQVLVISLTNFNLALLNVAFLFAFVWGAYWAASSEPAETRT